MDQCEGTLFEKCALLEERRAQVHLGGIIDELLGLLLVYYRERCVCRRYECVYIGTADFVRRVAERIDRADAKTVVNLREYTSVILIILLKKPNEFGAFAATKSRY